MRDFSQFIISWSVRQFIIDIWLERAFKIFMEQNRFVEYFDTILEAHCNNWGILELIEAKE